LANGTILSMPTAAPPAAPPVVSSGLRRHVPNAITLLRLVGAVGFFLILALAVDPETPHRAFWGKVATIVFVVSALSDILDGYLARRWQVVSGFGRVMDPFCDKILVLGGFILLAGSAFVSIDPVTGARTMLSGVAAWMVVAILSRELLVTTIRSFFEAQGVEFGADVVGKVKMFSQSVAVPICVLVGTHQTLLASGVWTGLRDTVVWIAVFVTVVSAVPYLIRTRRLIAVRP